MEIKQRIEQGVLILSVEGRLDHESAEIFRTTASKAIDAGSRAVLVDFGGTTFLASMGIRALILPSQELTQRGGSMAITGLSAELKKLFELAGLYQLFTVYPSVEEGVRSMAPSV